MLEFKPFPKVPRLSRECIITEKIDGTNASIHILDLDELPTVETPPEALIVSLRDHLYAIIAGSRKRFITPKKDNYGFARWVHNHSEELVLELGHGNHFGEWWGSGIQRGYGLVKGEKRFSLFNVHRWADDSTLNYCSVVPVLHQGPFDTDEIRRVLRDLEASGSRAAPGYENPEGIMIYHSGSRHLFKKTFDGDEAGKGK